MATEPQAQQFEPYLPNLISNLSPNPDPKANPVFNPKLILLCQTSLWGTFVITLNKRNAIHSQQCLTCSSIKVSTQQI